MNVETYLNEKYEFHYNEILNRTFYKKKKTKDQFDLLKNFEFNSIRRELNNNSVSTSISELKSLLESDFVSIYNPFEDYFNNLPDWDGKTDYISQLTDTIITTNQKDFKWAFKKWLVAMVACAINEDITNQAVLILTGKQGIGKTTWLKNLVP